MSNIPYDLKGIKCFVLDMDGVISATVSPVAETGFPMRTVNVKDGYAMQYAVKQGYILAVISGGDSQPMRSRFEQLGVQYIYMKIKDKKKQLEILEEASGISRQEMAYIGDDVPDLEIMQAVALSVAPSDAVSEIREAATYVSHYAGGYGVVRDLIEQTLKAQGKWALSEGFGW